jgi:hypothetical protein
MLFHFALLALHTVQGAEVCADDQCANKIVKDEAVMMMQDASRRGGAKTMVVEQKSQAVGWSKDKREESINHLMQSTAKMLKSGVTPEVAKFATATIETIEADAVPAMRDEHKATQQLLNKVFSTFDEIVTKIEVAQTEIDKLATNEQKAKSAHNQCREEQQAACDTSTNCNNTLADLWKVVEAKETLMDGSHEDISDSWCGNPIPDALDKGFYDDNVVHFDRYIKRKKDAEEAWNNYNAKFPVCQQFASDFYKQKAACEEKQNTLEKSSCARASKVLAENTRFEQEWADANKTYKSTTNTELEMAEDRKKEYVGIQTVKCLLDNIHENANLGEPCDETTHPDLVNKQIESCHTAPVNTDEFTLSPEPVPDTPDEFRLDPYPCGEDYLQWIGYNDLERTVPCALAHSCQKLGCSQALNEYSVTVALANGNMYDISFPKMLPPSVCSHGCANWSDLAGDGNTRSQTDVDKKWANGKAPPDAGRNCAMPSNDPGDTYWCYCKDSHDTSWDYCRSPTTPMVEQLNLQFAKNTYSVGD